MDFSVPLPSLVKKKYDSAKAAGALTFSPTELSVIRVSEVPIQLRYCPSLSKKPEPQDEQSSHDQPKKEQKPNPFLNPPEDLLVAHIPAQKATHLLVLNKFPIINQHFILATIEPKNQTHFLEEDDIAATFSTLKRWEAGQSPRRLFAFYNSGRWSGASQPHRHVQFLPIEAMREDLDACDSSDTWNPLIDAITHGAASVRTPSLADSPGSDIPLYTHNRLPVYHYAVRFPTDRDPSPGELHAAYRALYDAALAAVHRFIDYHPNSLSLHSLLDEHGATDPDKLPMSYNLGMTTRGMVMLPRRREGIMLDLLPPQEPTLEGCGEMVDLAVEAGREKQAFAAVNGAVLAGTVMVREQALWGCMRQGNGGGRLGKLLEGIGIPRGRVEELGNL